MAASIPVMTEEGTNSANTPLLVSENSICITPDRHTAIRNAS